jgi:hypothetical protein
MARVVHAVIKGGAEYRPFFERPVPGGRTSPCQSREGAPATLSIMVGPSTWGVSRIEDGEDHGDGRWILCWLWERPSPLTVEATWLTLTEAPIKPIGVLRFVGPAPLLLPHIGRSTNTTPIS